MLLVEMEGEWEGEGDRNNFLNTFLDLLGIVGIVGFEDIYGRA